MCSARNSGTTFPIAAASIVASRTAANGFPSSLRRRGSFALLEEEDGPMLELLKRFHREPILLPTQSKQRPDRERLAERYDRFLQTG
jgi:hypothetical protein